MTRLTDINKNNLPDHIAIIMDGNGRWAKKQSKIRMFGHKVGIKAVKDTVEAGTELGLKYLTLYAFSSENWNRPKKEIDALMELLVNTIIDETKTLIDNNIKLEAIGNLQDLPKNCFENLKKTIEKTANNSQMTLILALSCSSKKEISSAFQSIAKKIAKRELIIEEINEQTIENHLFTRNIPDPELLIRTSGEQRISNFLLWQIAYSELYFTDVLWPDFRREDLYEAILNYQKRERRFGKTSEQIKKDNV